MISTRRRFAYLVDHWWLSMADIARRLGVSRQRVYQLQHIAAGRCVLCPRTAVRSDYCAGHYRRMAIQHREWNRQRYGYAAQYDGPPRRRPRRRGER